jgi:NADH:ubiquinone oxidoreductase subunit
MAKKRMRRVRRAWSKDDIKELKAHSRAKTPVVKIAKATKRSALALRQKAWQLGIALGHRR